MTYRDAVKILIIVFIGLLAIYVPTQNLPLMIAAGFSVLAFMLSLAIISIDELISERSADNNHDVSI